MWSLLVLMLSGVASSAAATPDESSTSSLGENAGVVYRALDKCSKRAELGQCLRVKALGLLERALAADGPLKITDYLSLSRDPAAEPPAPDSALAPKTEAELEALLPPDAQQRNDKLDDMIADRLSTFLRTRTLQFSIPADLIEGRKKKGKGSMLLMAAMAMAGMMLQMAMGKIAMIAGKALLVGKMALLLSAIIGLKKLLGGGGGGDSHQVVYATEQHGGGGGGWSRGMDLAYWAQARNQPETL